MSPNNMEFGIFIFKRGVHERRVHGLTYTVGENGTGIYGNVFKCTGGL